MAYKIVWNSLTCFCLLVSVTINTHAQNLTRVPQTTEFNNRLETLLAMPDSDHRNQQIAVLYQLWTRFHPEEAYQSLHSNKLPNNLPLSVMEGMAITNWLKIRPDDAMQAAIDSNFPENLDLAFRIYAHQNGEAAFNLARSLGNSVSMDTWIGIIEGIASWDAKRAAEYVENFGTGGEKLISSFIYLLSTQDPKFSIDWLLQNYPDETEHYDPIVARFLALDPDGANDFISSLPDSTYKNIVIESLERAEKIARGEIP